MPRDSIWRPLLYPKRLSLGLSEPRYHVLPGSRESFRDATGVDPANLYLLAQVTAAPVADLGYEGQDLKASSAPQFGYQQDGSTFSRSTTAGQFLSGSGGQVLTSSAIYGCAFLVSSASSGATRFGFGQSTAVGKPIFQMRVLNDTTKFACYCSDTGSFATLIAPDQPALSDGQERLLLMQQDKRDNLFRIRLSGHGDVVTGSVSIVGCGPISSPGSFLYTHGVPGFLFGTDFAISMLFTASGSDCEGAARLESISMGLGFE